MIGGCSGCCSYLRVSPPTPATPSGRAPQPAVNCIWSSRSASTCPNLLRRAGLDYHDLASVTVHASLAHAWEALSPARVFAFTAQATTLFTNVGYRAGDVLMFGPEPTGLDEATLADTHITGQVRIPMLAGRRSLNLSNAAAVAVYEAWRQHGFAGAV